MEQNPLGYMCLGVGSPLLASLSGQEAYVCTYRFHAHTFTYCSVVGYGAQRFHVTSVTSPESEAICIQDRFKFGILAPHSPQFLQAICVSHSAC